MLYKFHKIVCQISVFMQFSGTRGTCYLKFFETKSFYFVRKLKSRCLFTKEQRQLSYVFEINNKCSQNMFQYLLSELLILLPLLFMYLPIYKYHVYLAVYLSISFSIYLSELAHTHPVCLYKNILICMCTETLFIVLLKSEIMRTEQDPPSLSAKYCFELGMSLRTIWYIL